MRLPASLLIELTVAGVLVAGAGAGGVWALREVRAFQAYRAGGADHDRNAARSSRAASLHPRQEPPGDSAPEVALESAGTFLGMSDELLLDRIRKQPVARLKLNHGG